jgi:D-alanine-D-alanine ligase
MDDLGRVMVLAGGLSHEREVSLRSGRRVAEALRALGVDVVQRDADSELVSALHRGRPDDRPDVVFPLLHGVQGEDGAIQEVLTLAGIPFVGSPPWACRLSFDKPVAKAVVERAGIATPVSVVLPQATFRELGATVLLEEIVARIGLPLVVKPARGGSALGTTIVQKADHLPGAMVECFAYGEAALIEQWIDGTEIAVSVLDTGEAPSALPAVEIVPESGS